MFYLYWYEVMQPSLFSMRGHGCHSLLNWTNDWTYNTNFNIVYKFFSCCTEKFLRKYLKINVSRI